MISSIQLDPDYPGLGIILAGDDKGLSVQYLPMGGALYPGRVWTSQDAQYRVTFFIPLPDGQPQVLAVTPL